MLELNLLILILSLIASYKGHIDCVTALLQSGSVDLNLKDNDGNTALSYGKCTKILLSKNIKF